MTGTLLDMQRRMAAAVMEPLTPRESMRKKRRDGVVMAQEAPDFIKPSTTLTSFERLEIYNRQYWFRLYSSFEDDFPGLKAVLGAKRFERVMRAYIAARPSNSYTLRDLGARLPEWLAGNESFTGSESLLAQDVVRLEWTHIEAYDAASYPLPTQEFFASIAEETRLSLQPCVRPLAMSYPADEFLVRLRQDAGSGDTSSNNATATRKAHSVRRVAPLTAEPVWLAVHRQEFTVFYKRLRQEEYQMLLALQLGEPLGEVFSRGFADSPMTQEAKPAFLQDCFEQWTVLGWLCNRSTTAKRSHSGDSR